MSKLLFWVGVILVGLLVMRLAARHAVARNQRNPKRAPGRRQRAKAFEPMVQCAHCGVHLPAAEAHKSGGLHWCSADHARLGAKPPRPE